MVRVGEIQCKTIMGRSGIGSVEYAINPYLGCQHGCVYCYAKFMGRWGGHVGEEWGSFVDVKVNALERLRAEAARKRRDVVLLSSVTDPYQPLERERRLTRGCLEILLERQFPVSILTKSDLVLRDVDLIRELESCEVGFTLTAYDDSVRESFEPGASTVGARLDALRRLSDEGITTWAFLGPMLPHLSEEGLEELLNELTGSVSHVIVDRLNVKSGIMSRVSHVLYERYPDTQPLFKSALSKGSGYYSRLKREVAEMCRLRGIPCNFVY
ncbi:MAG: radical SAM protein [Candidatus Bathyarchaeota archaeon]|nr:MAG: radical SAM protein [Candidatus Bathyarchaeota archaeon]